MSEVNGNAPEPVPEFDLSGVTLRWRRRWGEILIRTDEILIEGGSLQFPDLDDSVAGRAYVTQATPLMREAQNLGDEQAKLISQVLVSVPVEWLASDAPEALDWHDPESLDWVLEDRYVGLVQALNRERQANSKNLRTSTSSPPRSPTPSAGKATT